MALERGKLTNVTQVAAGSTSSIIAVSSSKKVYVKSIIAHAGTASSCAVQVYFVPNGSTAGPTNKIFDFDLQAGETTMVEPSYPLVIDTTGDAIHVGAAVSTVNVILTGDKEA